ncbi:hypothetical protein D030_1854B, partial [Vibrio parahaemolyticus AQ3810]
LMQF